MKALTTIAMVLLISFSTYSQDLTIYFDYDKAELNATAKQQLDELIARQSSQEVRYRLEGHTDADGSNAYNSTLSMKRVKATEAYLLNKGIASSMVVIDYKGELQPADNNETDDAKQNNRRVEIYAEKVIVEDPVIAAEESIDYESEFIKMLPADQVFEVHMTYDNVISCNEGTQIFLPANSFVKKNGQRAVGKVKVIVSEYYTDESIITAKLSTTCEDKLLETAGMIHISVYQGEQELELAQGKTYGLIFPEASTDDGYGVFYGNETDDEIVTWDEFAGDIIAVGENVFDLENMTNQMAEVQGITQEEAREIIRNNSNKPIFTFNNRTINAKSVNVGNNYSGGNFMIYDAELGTMRKPNKEELAAVNNSIKSRQLMSSAKLGWINCDRFYNDKNAERMLVKINLEGENMPLVTNVCLILIKERSVLQLSKGVSGSYSFPSGYKPMLPKNAKVKILAYGHDHDAFYMQTKEVVANDIVETLTLEAGTLVDFKKAVNRRN